SKVIAAAALARDDSRGAHWRADFPATGDLETSTFTSARLVGGKIDVAMRPVKFTRVRPGESLIKESAAE
ncbi:MAG: succinate dehydrogenase/fumarate reductase flavoprotein subunit, partial [Rhodospirillales bacterium]|nr:succinate dehydrogenase/fumarate reductase flavoprotein subunit [Rhodospirillales bacterium]